MSNQSPFVKFTVWLMVFLMSIGFIALIIQPFFNGGGLFGNDPNEATLDIIAEARADIKKNNCDEDPKKMSSKTKETCRDSLIELGSGYKTLANSVTDDTQPKRDAQKNIDLSLDAFKTAYKLDTKNTETAEIYAASLRDAGKSAVAIPIWKYLVNEDKTNEKYLLQLGVAYSQTNATDKAITTYRSFIKRFPDSGQVPEVKDEIKRLQDQAKGGSSGAPSSPITVG